MTNLYKEALEKIVKEIVIVKSPNNLQIAYTIPNVKKVYEILQELDKQALQNQQKTFTLDEVRDIINTFIKHKKEKFYYSSYDEYSENTIKNLLDEFENEK